MDSESQSWFRRLWLFLSHVSPILQASSSTGNIHLCSRRSALLLFLRIECRCSSLLFRCWNNKDDCPVDDPAQAAGEGGEQEGQYPPAPRQAHLRRQQVH